MTLFKPLPFLACCLLSFGSLCLTENISVAQTNAPGTSVGSEQQAALARAEELDAIASGLFQQGRYAEAVPIVQETLSIRETALGPDHPEVAADLNNLGLLYRFQGNYNEALPLHERALLINEATLGPNHPSVAITLNNLAALYRFQGDYDRAASLQKRAISIQEAALGLSHSDVAISLNNLAELYQVQGNYSEALSLYERALSIYESTLGPNHPNVAISLDNLAALYRLQGNYDEAIALNTRALSIFEAALDPNHSSIAISLGNLSFLYGIQKNYDQAIALTERALSISETTLGPNHPTVAAISHNLGFLYRYQGNYEKALSLYEHALSIQETTLGPNHPDVATSLNSLSVLYGLMRNYSEALPLQQRSLSIQETVFGPNHPDIAISLNNIAELHRVDGNDNEALLSYERAASIEEQALSDVLTSTSEERRQRYINTFFGITSTLVSVSLNDMPDSQQATELALSTILRRKGRVLDVTSNSLQQLTQQLTSEDQARLSELNATRSQLSNLRFSGLGNRSIEQYQAELQTLEARAQALEEQLARSSAAFKTEIEPVTIDSVTAALPADAALIEFVRYNPFNFTATFSQRWGEPRYAAYIITQQGDIQSIDLGTADAIDTLVANLQTAISTPPTNRTSEDSLIVAAKALDEKVMAPLRPFLTNTTQLLLSPDSHLNLIPFDALIDENNSYLINNYQISYLTSGRDLLKLRQNTPSQQPPVVIANPNYDRTEPSAASPSSKTRSVDLTNLQFGPLPGTQTEADAIIPLLPNAQILTQQAATEDALKQVQAPSILHIATHGFFLPDVDFIPTVTDSSRGLDVSPYNPPAATPAQPTPSNLENPLLRSGLALAGFNTRSSGSEDGVFTALEASGLNLYGTELVVLSACETGIGAASTGEGVYGLRRAFTIAGAQSQLMSLWQVSDEGTAKLMQQYYDNLMKKQQGRSEALRNAQLEMMTEDGYDDPFYWSAFIFSGDWRSLNYAKATE